LPLPPLRGAVAFEQPALLRIQLYIAVPLREAPLDGFFQRNRGGTVCLVGCGG
jgi:hypothetical protein